MQVVSAREAKHQFGRHIDTPRTQPVAIEKHGPPVVAVVAIEEHEGLKAIDDGITVSTASGPDSNEQTHNDCGGEACSGQPRRKQWSKNEDTRGF